MAPLLPIGILLSGRHFGFLLDQSGYTLRNFLLFKIKNETEIQYSIDLKITSVFDNVQRKCFHLAIFLAVQYMFDI
jgi:hypothetical protein